MNLNMIRPEKELEDLLLSTTKKCEMLIKRTLTKPKETSEFKLTKPKQTFHFTTPIPIQRFWMIELTSLEVSKSILNITTTNNRFELFTDAFDKFSLEELKDEIEEIINISEITSNHLQHETMGPRVIQACKKLRSEKSRTCGYNVLLESYA